MFDYTDFIKQKFQLFQGKRELIEDEKLLNEVNDLVEEEVLRFIKTTVKDNYKIDSAIKGTNEPQVIKQLEILLSEKDIDWQLNLTARINYFLNQLVYDSVQIVIDEHRKPTTK